MIKLTEIKKKGKNKQTTTKFFTHFLIYRIVKWLCSCAQFSDNKKNGFIILLLHYSNGVRILTHVLFASLGHFIYLEIERNNKLRFP
jgi:hypothetical protein